MSGRMTWRPCHRRWLQRWGRGTSRPRWAQHPGSRCTFHIQGLQRHRHPSLRHNLGAGRAALAALAEAAPARVPQTEAALIGMAPKAYLGGRDARDLVYFTEEAGSEPDPFRAVAEDTVLGHEKIGARQLPPRVPTPAE